MKTALPVELSQTGQQAPIGAVQSDRISRTFGIVATDLIRDVACTIGHCRLTTQRRLPNFNVPDMSRLGEGDEMRGVSGAGTDNLHPAIGGPGRTRTCNQTVMSEAPNPTDRDKSDT
jgi:hypothetical protein